ncbi:thioester reductase domain-containing protein [Pelosinus fermentans]|uniref:Thioester reductase domain protein n=1 Tax=Pelosinus fermentans JBW45 TaxID=1192197 RepID=I9NV79_9FIRM|nr:thioester reductase domain-containing protein [Pelosinus fermentans]AJQ26214.1 thioester reductase domain protein [Pelosinus fermentans JBW45]
MESQLSSLYKQIKDKKISREDAIRQIQEHKAKQTQQHILPILENHALSKTNTATLIEGIQTVLLQRASELSRVTIEDIDLEAQWNENGLDQVMLAALADRLNQDYKLELLPSIFYTQLTIQSFAEYLVNEHYDMLAGQIQAKELSHSITEKSKVMTEFEEELLKEKAIRYFKQQLSSVLKLPVHRIDENAQMEKYGIDSIMVMQLTNELEKIFGSLPKTLFFEYESLHQITDYFLAAYRTELIKILNVEYGTAISAKSDSSAGAEKKNSLFRSPRKLRTPEFSEGSIRQKAAAGVDVAIIGVSGRYPGARNLQEYWRNLRDGKDCITEIPKDRWDHSLYFDEDKNKLGKTYGKWGGFLEGVDQFDPLFFNISPREAQFIDPQERLFLQCVFETLEDAGYTRQDLGLKENFNVEGNVGVYVGVMYEEYQLYGAQEQIQGRPIALSGNPSSVANRVSYFFNFHGPSMAIDTMCSSSLTAIHLACQSLQQGGCEIAIAGGVNVSIHPNKYLMLGQGKFISSKGRCESFGQGGDGYVPGEGVGAVLLKPLTQAIADGDNIYGIIKATAINHGGKTNGYTVPNPNAQARVIGQAFAETGINPRMISYIEAHGTGTSLGDPIEIAGLSKFFKEHTKDKQFCAIGSAKSNIGHCESAAGIAGVTKVLLQLKYRQLVPSLHSKTLNPNIDFNNTPFFVQQELAEWKRPLINIHGKTEEHPRIAGISSFGAGGSNAHVVIEEYIPEDQNPVINLISQQHPAMIVLSAKNEERLLEKVRQLLLMIKEVRFFDANLAEIAYTLQIGRETMDERLAIAVNSIKELEEKLGRFLERDEDIENLYRGQNKRNKEILAALGPDEDMAVMIDSWMRKGKYTKLLEVWVKGLIIDWKKLYGKARPRRISLPTYPFAKERYWVPEFETTAVNHILTHTGNALMLHPLLHQNTSDLTEQRFTSKFSGKETFFVNHVKGFRVLPEAACLEMVREALQQAAGRLQEGQKILITNIRWMFPVAVDESLLEVHIGLIPENSSEIIFEVYSQPGGREEETIIYSQGTAVFSDVSAENIELDLAAIQEQCRNHFNASQCYEALRNAGFNYGPEYRGMEFVYVGRGQVLAKLVMPSCIAETQSQFMLHPSLLNAGMQATIGFILNSEDRRLMLPVALQELEILGPCSPAMWAWLRYSEGSAADTLQKLDIDLCDTQGKVCIRMKGLEMQGDTEESTSGDSVEELRQTPAASKKQEAFEMMTFEETWQEQALSNRGPVKIRTLVCFLSNVENQNKAAEEIQTLDPQTRILFISQHPNHTASSHTIYPISRKDPSTYEQAFQSIREDYGEIDGMLYLWTIEDATCIEDYSVIVYLLQSIAAVKLKAGRVLLGAQFETGLERCYLDSWVGFERSLGLVLPNTQVAVTYQKSSGPDAKSTMEDWLTKLWSELQTEKLQSVFYQEGKRYVYQIQETFLETGSSLLQAGGTYLITGGCGGLGFLFARHFAKTHAVNLILTGRSALDAKKQAKIHELEALGSHALYLQADSCDVSSMRSALAQAKAKYGEIHGVIHAAGLAGSQSLFEKDLAGFKKIIEPKIKGTLVLDEVLQEVALHFMCYFSSSSAILGDFGSCDYAIGNRFQMAYAHYRQEKQLEGKGYGKSLVINWPLWKDGGMGVGEEENSKLYLKSSGQRFLEAEEGTVMFDCILSQSTIQQLVLVGQPSRIKRFLGLTHDDVSLSLLSLNSPSRGRRPEMKGLNLEQCVEWDLKEYISQLLKIPFNKLDKEENLADFGFDSISLTQLAALLRSHYGIEVTATLFFGYSTIEKLTQYFVTDHHNIMDEFYKEEAVWQPMEQKRSTENKAVVGPKFQRIRFARRREDTEDIKQQGSIAIVGMSGKFPMAEDVHELWGNIVEGRDCIAEIPKERWDWQKFYGDAAKEVNKTKIKWGGFITEIDEFDSLFFKISPKEAESMDPKQRMLMTFVWRAMEDAGITPKEMSKKSTGVFIAACPSEYTDSVSMQNNSLALTSTTPTVLPARISYALDLQGPSEYCDTACSSTLVALHRAVQAIQNNECEQAIVGAVNLLLSPLGFIGLDSLGYLSPEGKAKSFQSDANGYARSEGVGVLIIKPLRQAIKDKDQIFAVVKGTGVSHGGKGMSLTAPNANGMKAAMIQAYQAAKIDPRTVSYIEAHGIASLLGDGIEVDALKAGYQELVARQTLQHVKNQHVCHIGSLKPCIGNAEVASGMAALIKVISAMRNRIIPGIAGFTTLSDHISLEGSPFQIAAGNYEWSALKNIYGSSLPRRASINGYGFSGINAHVVLEEYVPKQEHIPPEENLPYIVPLSAKNRARLDDYARNLLIFLKARDGAAADSALHLADVAYTLQVGREAMESRIAFIVKSIKELMEKLESFIDGTENAENYFSEDAKQGIAAQLLGTDDDFEELLHKWVAKGKMKKIAEVWSKGLPIEWELFYPDSKPQRISLPTYPFTRERYKLFLQQEKKSSTTIENVKTQSRSEDFVQGNPKDTLEYITRLVQDTLGLPSNVAIDPQSQLREYGMDSISGIQILDKIRQELGTQLDGRRFFSEFTLQSIIDQLKSVANQDKILLSPWEMDKKLPMSFMLNLKKTSFTHNSLPENIFLTGATGLLGAFLCNEILQQTSANVYCLVRAESATLGLQRIQENLNKFALWQSDYQSRIIPVLGDITMSQLGIEKIIYTELSHSIDAIYHCAALPNHILNYYSLRNANVNGTLAIIEFAAAGKIKPIHFTSTIAVCSQMDGDIMLPTHQMETLLGQGKNLTSGYAQSKWVSEHHLMQVQERGIPITIFRCGEITGSSQTGYGVTEDMVHNFLRIFSKVNAIPEWNEGVMDIVPVDYVSKVILAVSRQQDCYGKIYHLNHMKPFPVREFFAYLKKKNSRLSKISFEEWADRCLQYIIELPESSVKTVMVGSFTKLDSGSRVFKYYFTNMGLNNENLQTALQGFDVDFPKINDQWWEKCMNQILLFDR